MAAIHLFDKAGHQAHGKFRVYRHKEALQVEGSDIAIHRIPLADFEDILLELLHRTKATLADTTAITVRVQVVVLQPPIQLVEIPRLHETVAEVCGQDLAQSRYGDHKADTHAHHILHIPHLVHQLHELHHQVVLENQAGRLHCLPATTLPVDLIPLFKRYLVELQGCIVIHIRFEERAHLITVVLVVVVQSTVVGVV